MLAITVCVVRTEIHRRRRTLQECEGSRFSTANQIAAIIMGASMAVHKPNESGKDFQAELKSGNSQYQCYPVLPSVELDLAKYLKTVKFCHSHMPGGLQI